MNSKGFKPFFEKKNPYNSGIIEKQIFGGLERR
jgi:hypothetical protein